jgi:hypothetical protein
MILRALGGDGRQNRDVRGKQETLETRACPYLGEQFRTLPGERTERAGHPPRPALG